MDDLLREFLTETNESIATLDVELVNLEQNPNNPPLIDNIFRLVHTIKGTCGFLGLPRLAAVAHSGENILGKFREGKLVVTPAAVTLILESIDRIKELLAQLEQLEAEPAGDDNDLIERLDAMAEGKTPAGAAPPPPPPPVVVAAPPAPASDGDFDHALGRALKPGEVSLEELERVFQETAVLPASTGAAAPPPGVPAPVEAPKPPAPAKPTASAAPPKEAVATAVPAESSVANQSIRVSVDLLENLMTMVSELVLTRNQLLQMVRSLDNSEFTVPLQRLSHVTTELQEGVMKTRMQPIGNAWAKLPRIIRDLSVELGKKIDLQMHGAETELDRQVLELIKDPLTHMVRNSADHGIEAPADRLQAGKPEAGRIALNAFHEGGHIIIEIKDDGRGLNTRRIRQKAIENGLATEAELDSMSTQQIHMFVFKAGFSTAAAVTSVSGRGVGMDVVRTNIEKIGGTIELKSEEGKGSTFTIKIPLTLAIVSALIVECAAERYAIPQISVVELVRVSGNSEMKIERINDTPVLRLRNRLLPLVFLDQTLRLVDVTDEIDTQSEKFIVVTLVGSYQFGIVVDRVFDTEEIVVKPVAPILRDIPMFSGNTILGDGSVIMILDPNGIATASSETATTESTVIEDELRLARSSELMALLLFTAGGKEPKAVPLSLVARLEEIDVGQIEFVNGRHVVQYRGKLMPLVTMREGFQMRSEGRQPILVFSDHESTLGLMVDEIVDIVESELNIELKSSDQGILGSAVIAGQATEIIDVGYFLTRAFGDWFKNHDDSPFGQASEKHKVLLVDDSPFFRNMLVPLLSVAGYAVETADNAEVALKRRDEGEQFSVIISDIEMPGMNGFEFAEEVKRDYRWRETPIIALSSHTNKSDFDRGREVGFADYVAKFDREALLKSLAQTLSAGGTA